jgi:hypothetical protein
MYLQREDWKKQQREAHRAVEAGLRRSAFTAEEIKKEGN